MRLTAENQERYLGSIQGSYLSYSNDDRLRSNCASGGIVTVLLSHLLRKGTIDGAYVCRHVMNEDRIAHEVKIVTDPDEVAEFAGSVYFDIPLLSNLESIRDFDGRIAVVGLPCQIKALSVLCSQDKEIADKIALKIGLFCGHNSCRELIQEVLKKKGILERDVKKVIFRKGHWRGDMHILTTDKNEIVFPFHHFSTYQNLHIDSLKKCMHCHDHTAEHSDVSCGDAWLSYLRSDPIKHSILITRTEKSDELVRGLRREGTIYLMGVEPEIVFESQRRALLYHKAIEARSRVGEWFGYKIGYPSEYENTSRWNDYLSAAIALSNIKMSYNSKARAILHLVPRQILFLYLLLFKLLTNF